MDWYSPVRNSVYYKTGDMQKAEDITQETFLKIRERKDTINIQTVGPLLIKIYRKPLRTE
jgi:RNA polymerase sigma-70 factor (ECF subfamily)